MLSLLYLNFFPILELRVLIGQLFCANNEAFPTGTREGWSSNFPQGGFGPLSLIFDLRKKGLALKSLGKPKATFMAFTTPKHDKKASVGEGRRKGSGLCLPLQRQNEGKWEILS